LEAQANSIPDPLTTYELFDRVINVREGYSVPLGLRGTVIGINAGMFGHYGVSSNFEFQPKSSLFVFYCPNRYEFQ
jgi:hypothetical protein